MQTTYQRTTQLIKIRRPGDSRHLAWELKDVEGNPRPPKVVGDYILIGTRYWEVVGTDWTEDDYLLTTSGTGVV